MSSAGGPPTIFEVLPVTTVFRSTTHGAETGPVDIEYTVTLTNVNNTGTAITFEFDDAGSGTATSGADYTAVGGAAQISVADGQSTGTARVRFGGGGDPRCIFLRHRRSAVAGVLGRSTPLLFPARTLPVRRPFRPETLGEVKVPC